MPGRGEAPLREDLPLEGVSCLFLSVIVEAIFRKDIGACCEAVPLAVAAYSIRSLLLPHLEGEEPPEASF